MSTNELDKLESFLRDNLSQQTYSYDAADWDALEKRMDSASKVKTNSKVIKILAAASLIGAAGYFCYSHYHQPLQNRNSISSEKAIEPDKKIIKKEIATKDLIPNHQPTDNLSLQHKESKETTIKKTELSESEFNQVYDEKAPTLEPSRLNNPASDRSLRLPHQLEITQPIANFEISELNACVGEKINFHSIPQENTLFTWNFDDGTTSYLPNPKHIYHEPGNYTIELTARSGIDKTIKQSFTATIVINPKPEIDFQIVKTLEEGMSKVSFIPSTEDLQSYSWSFGDHQFSEERHPIHYYRFKGNYNVLFTGINSDGCKSTINREVNIAEDYNLLAPNSFTPNGDGLNDTFIPAALKRFDADFTMTIYSNSGLIYQTKNNSQPWDGIDMNTGFLCPQGNYIWVVTLVNENGKQEQYKGAIYLLK